MVGLIHLNSLIVKGVLYNGLRPAEVGTCGKDPLTGRSAFELLCPADTLRVMQAADAAYSTGDPQGLKLHIGRDKRLYQVVFHRVRHEELVLFEAKPERERERERE